jgi:hypothetical protein
VQLLKFGGGYIKPVWWGLLLLFILPVLTCTPFAPGGGGSDYDPDGITYTNVVYSPDGKSVTLYLDGPVPVTNRQSRAINQNLAVAGHDYFEVAFYTGTQYVRASWELKMDVYISGSALRGINFDSVSATGLGSGQGAAIIFVGKKTDKTLLGVGKLTSTIDRDKTTGVVTTGTTSITTNTESITFTVAPLECGVTSPAESNFNQSSFYTDYKTPGTVAAAATEYSMFKITDFGSPPVDRLFPKFALISRGVTRARYNFKTLSGTNFDLDYKPGIIVAGPAEYMKKQPRYPIPGGGFQYYSLRLDDRTLITPENNDPGRVGYTLENPLTFNFDTRGVDQTSGTEDDTVSGSAFALVFQVPVYPLSTAADPGKWYIRASYDSYWLDLDAGVINPDGRSAGTGGAVLMGMGDPAVYSSYTLQLVGPPVKYKYGPAGVTGIPSGYILDITGLRVAKVTNPGLTFIEWATFEELNFYIGGWSLDAGWTAQVYPHDPAGPLGEQNEWPGSLIPSELYGMQIIKVEYIDPYTGDDYSVSFPILCSGGDPLRDYTNIPDANKLYIRTPVTQTGSLTGVLNVFFNNNNPANPKRGTYMLFFDGPFDWSFVTTLEATQGPFLIIILAAAPNVILGRPSYTHTPFLDWSRRNAFYFGTWPFDLPMNNVPVFALDGTTGTTTTVTATYPFIVNAGGPYSDVVVPAPPGLPSDGSGGPPPADFPEYNASSNTWVGPGRFYIHSGQAGRIYNVVTDDGNVRVVNEEWLR